MGVDPPNRRAAMAGRIAQECEYLLLSIVSLRRKHCACDLDERIPPGLGVEASIV
jgi:hypothetical protein